MTSQNMAESLKKMDPEVHNKTWAPGKNSILKKSQVRVEQKLFWLESTMGNVRGH